MNTTIFYKGAVALHLSRYLIEKQGLTAKEVNKLRNLHIQRLELFDRAKQENDPAALREMADELEQLEFTMQRTWGFEEDKDKHTWWFHLPGCNCPKIDNMDMVYTGMRITSGDCCIHWKQKDE